MQKNDYKIIFSDLDETLLVDGHIPSFNVEAIQKAREKGVKFVMCTGRNFEEMKHLLKELNTENLQNEYSICCSGSVIYENKNKKLIYSKVIDNETLNLLFEFGKTIPDIYIFFDTFDGVYIFDNKSLNLDEWGKFKYKAISDVKELKNTEIIRIIYSKKDINYLFDIQNKIKNDKRFDGKISYYIASNKFLEFNAFGVCKGEALKWLSNYLQIDIKDTIAIGDNFNDESMIKTAGLGACVKGAQDEIKKISKYVCEKDYFEGAVKEIIEKFVL